MCSLDVQGEGGLIMDGDKNGEREMQSLYIEHVRTIHESSSDTCVVVIR